ncbi:unnamed protein product [Rotaria sp. Silwood1]|nr:unnamed protein product [Rotaria sp. Silwood1]
MNQFKRKLSSDDLSEKKTTKKLRNEFDQFMTCFEDLSNELLFEIFDYLDGYRLYEAFSDLNSRFEQLYSSSILFKSHCCLIKLDEVFNIFKQFSYFFSSFLFDSSFDRVESNIFEKIQSDTHIPVLSNLSSLPNLTSLTIETSNVQEEINDINRLIFVLHKLKYYRIFFSNNCHLFTLPLALNNQCSPIEYLVINHDCSLNELLSLISYTPKLRRLTGHKIKTNDSNITILSPITLVNLNLTYLDLHQTTFNVLEIFITKRFPNLKSLFIASSDDITFFNAYRWEQFILNNFPHKRWYDDTEDNIINHYVKHSTFTNLTFECIPSSINSRKKVSIPALIQAVNLLPNITTLKIHSLSTDKTTESTLKQLLVLCSIKETIDEQIVKNIERMINGEKLLSNFRVKRILDTVYLRWK